MKGWMSLYHQVSLVEAVICFVQFVKMCILLSVINPGLSVISCTGDVVEKIQNKLTAHFTTRHIVTIEGVSTSWRLLSVLGLVSLFGTAMYYDFEPNPVRRENQRKPVALICAFSGFNFTVSQ
jgi:hypothetical protein